MLTSHGRLALGFGLLAVPAGWLLGYPVIIMLGLVGPLLVLGAVLSTRARPDMHGAISVWPERALPGRPVIVSLTVENRGERPNAALEFDLAAFGETTIVPVDGLAGGESKQRDVTLLAPTRGLYTIGPLKVSVSDPFGLTRRVLPVAPAQPFTVLPRRAELGLPPSPGRRDLDGMETDRAVAGSVTFHSLREYVPGDERRHVHWPTYARTNKLMVKQFEDTSQFRSVVILDCASSSYQRVEDFETAIEIAASLVESSLARGAPTELRIGDAIVTGRLMPEVPRFLDLLASTEPSDVDPSLIAFGAFTSGEVGGNLACISGPASITVRRAVTEIGRQFDDVAMVEVRDVEARSSTVRRVSGINGFTCATLEQFVVLWDDFT